MVACSHAEASSGDASAYRLLLAILESAVTLQVNNGRTFYKLRDAYECASGAMYKVGQQVDGLFNEPVLSSRSRRV